MDSKTYTLLESLPTEVYMGESTEHMSEVID